MRYQGGGVGHSSTREATNKFLFNHDRLDVPDGNESVESDIEEDENGDSDVNGEDDVADAGHISGGDEANGAAGDGNGFVGDKDNDYSYKDNGDDENSEPELDLADNALGPEDGEGEGDEMYLLGFAAL